jgi:hypothetical protein
MHRSQSFCLFLNTSWKSCSVEGVRHRLRFCFDHLSLCQNGGLSVLSSIGETENSRVSGGWQSSFGKKTPWWKRKCEAVRCHDAAASSFVAKVHVEVFACFHAVTVKVTVVCWIHCLACQDKFFVNSPLDVKENDDCSSPVSPFFGLGESGLFHWEDRLGRLRVIAINPAVVASDEASHRRWPRSAIRNRIRPDTN